MARAIDLVITFREAGLVTPLLLLLPFLFLTYHVVKAVFAPLRNVPGPFAARFSSWWYLRNVWRGNFEQVNIELHDRLGAVVRIAPNQYSIDDLEAMRTIYGHGTAFIKGSWYYASGDPNPNNSSLFTDQNTKRHSELRRKIANLYSMTSLLHLEPFVTTCNRRLIDKLDTLAQDGNTIDLQHWLQCYAFDTIGTITFARPFGFLDEGKDVGGILQALHNYLIYCANVGVCSWLHPYLFRLAAWLPGSGMEYLLSFTQQNIQDRLRKPGSEKRTEQEGDDFLSKMLREPEKFQKELFGTCLTNVGAGSDTTSVSLSGILYHLIKNPSKLAKLRAELDDHAATRNNTDLTTYAEAQSLPYLQACIKEGLRMHPATGLPLMRIVPAGGATLAGHYFPPGSEVGVNSWVAHRNKRVFGEDAAQFMPERWLESSERSSMMERYFMTFGAGSRTCIGKNISLLEIGKVVPELVRRFDFELVRQELRTENNWFVKQMDFEVRVKVRKVE
ncbi:Isotrichodermin C-15 hydroxylase [Sphaceloma murrayae]|uniref:Isotrichodermin C-15 hydroxylase n=1 Tax=Sphaceloma murrayae TaxID=2082308 RepID=A0A2K1QV50_9PEZI|nr:Isotrichodermin C-15 hydroxylase [Sphaceloma murrayae]